MIIPQASNGSARIVMNSGFVLVVAAMATQAGSGWVSAIWGTSAEHHKTPPSCEMGGVFWSVTGSDYPPSSSMTSSPSKATHAMKASTLGPRSAAGSAAGSC